MIKCTPVLQLVLAPCGDVALENSAHAGSELGEAVAAAKFRERWASREASREGVPFHHEEGLHLQRGYQFPHLGVRSQSELKVRQRVVDKRVHAEAAEASAHS